MIVCVRTVERLRSIVKKVLSILGYLFRTSASLGLYLTDRSNVIITFVENF